MWFNELRSGDDVPESQAVTHWDQVQLTNSVQEDSVGITWARSDTGCHVVTDTMNGRETECH